MDWGCQGDGIEIDHTYSYFLAGLPCVDLPNIHILITHLSTNYRWIRSCILLFAVGLPWTYFNCCATFACLFYGSV